MERRHRPRLLCGENWSRSLLWASQLAYSTWVCAAALPITVEVDAEETQRMELRGKQFCPREGATASAQETRLNEERRTFRELLGINPIKVSIRYKSADWENSDEIEARLDEALQSRPRLLTPTIRWSEGANLRRRSFVAVIHTAEGTDVRMEVSGYQICGDDLRGLRWHFRNVAIDLWP